ncbi:hypothetical protein [Ilumatobacter sp.]|uniref:helix-turn-helix transcriptional regulator n=1 Tax=Ilumatobacter sp. TaxID=1967498 RepID=UPI003B516013
MYALSRELQPDIDVVGVVDCADLVGRHDAIVLTVSKPDDWNVLRRCADATRCQNLVVLLDRPDQTAFAEAQRLRCRRVLARAADPAQLLGAVRAAVDDRRTRGDRGPPKHPGERRSIPARRDDSWTPEELNWLRLLASGLSVCDLAAEVGYSRRTMSRRLRTVYTRLDASRQTQALATAARLGLTNPERTPERLFG